MRTSSLIFCLIILTLSSGFSQTTQFRISDLTELDIRFDAGDPAVAFNSQDSTYLVVWEGIDLVTSNSDPEEFNVYGQLISFEGFPLGDHSNFRISQSGVGNTFLDARTPDVVYNSIENNFLVVWSADFETGRNEVFEILGRFVDADGVPDGDDFRISSMGQDDADPDFGAFNPEVAYSSGSNHYLVVWEGDDDLNTVDGEFEIFGQIVNTSGQLHFSNDQRYSSMGREGFLSFDALNPEIVYNETDDEFLLVWQGDDGTGDLANGEFEIYGQRITGQGLEIGIDLRISEQGDEGDADFDARRPAVAYNAMDNEYLVVWAGDLDADNSAAGDEEIFGQLLDDEGNDIADNFRISDMGMEGSGDSDAEIPSVQYDTKNNTYLVAWEGDDISGKFEIFGQFLSSAGAEIGDNDFRISEMSPNGNVNFDAFKTAMTYDPVSRRFLVVWEGDDNLETGDDQFEIFGELIESFDNPCPVQLTDSEIPSPIPSGMMQASDLISTSGLVEGGSDVLFDAGNQILLLPDFEVQTGAVLQLLIGGCDP